MDKFLKEKMKLIKNVKSLIRETKNIEDIQKENELIACDNCKESHRKVQFDENLCVCPSCDFHNVVGGYERIKQICDEDSFREINKGIKGYDPLKFPQYKKKIKEAKDKSSLNEAVITGTAKIDDIKVMLCVMDNSFMMASMGYAVGEKILRAVEYAEKKRLPLIIFSTSGGARMQEGIISLMQMAKTSAAIERFKSKGNLFISVMNNPTTGGVSASFASLGDIQIGEKGALIGFAGPRVISQTIGETLPEGFQSAKFLYDHGLLDMVVDRRQLRQKLALILGLYKDEKLSLPDINVQLPKTKKNTKEAFERVERARDVNKLTTQDYIDYLIDDFVELSGDRVYGEDKAILGGIGRFRGLPVTVIGHRKGKNLEENLEYRFGMPNPEGYRKALRLMQQAEKFNQPIITFVDTPGAYPGKEAEERGQASAIAQCLYTLAGLKVPVINVFIGEGGSGGALAIGFGDCMIMMENSIFSILSPEGFASILWKDSSLWKEACKDMKLTSYDLKELGVCDFIVNEDERGEESLKRLKNLISLQMKELLKQKKPELIKNRYKRLKNIGKDLT